MLVEFIVKIIGLGGDKKRKLRNYITKKSETILVKKEEFNALSVICKKYNLS